jgi:hypothetical protein
MSIQNKIGTFGGALPTPSPMFSASLFLQPSTFQFRDELSAAWDGAGRQTAKVDRVAVRNSMLNFWAKKRPNLTGSALEQFVKARHPLLFDDAAKRVSGMR